MGINYNEPVGNNRTVGSIVKSEFIEIIGRSNCRFFTELAVA